MRGELEDWRASVIRALKGRPNYETNQPKSLERGFYRAAGEPGEPGEPGQIPDSQVPATLTRFLMDELRGKTTF